MAQTHSDSTGADWTAEEIAARRAAWAAAAERLARTLPADGAFQAAVEVAVGVRLVELQRQMVRQAGQAAQRHRDPGKAEGSPGISYGRRPCDDPDHADDDAGLDLAA